MNSESEKIEIEYGQWFWDIALGRPVFTLYPHTDRYIACFCPVIKFDKPIYLAWEPVKRENIVKIMVNPRPLDY